MNLPEIDKFKLFEELGYKPHSAAQQSIHDSTARFMIPCCGRRFGKSQSIGHEITWRAFAKDAYIWIVGPTYKLAEKEFRVVYDDIIRKLRLPKVKKSNNVKQGDMRIELPWNTIIEAVSAEKQDSLVGEGLDYACVSEAALHQASTWTMYIEPALSDKRGGAAFPSTPRGNNWYKGLWRLGQKHGLDEYESWRFPTWMNTFRYPGGYNDPELVRIRSTVSDHFWQQEYAADFTSFEGQIYPDWDETVHVRKHTYNPAWANYLVFDFGFADPFVALDIQVDPSDNVYVWREYTQRYITTYNHGHILMNREQPVGYRVNRYFADPRGADEIATLQMVMHAYIEANVAPWGSGVEAIRRWLKIGPDGLPKLFIDPSCTELIRTLPELKTPESKGRQADRNREPRPGARAQHDHDDHHPDTLRYFFNEWEVLRVGSLEDVYDDPSSTRTEADSFFQLHTQVTRNDMIGYG